MGDVADMMLTGILCECCGVFLNEVEVGYPVKCSDCKKEAKNIHSKKTDKIKCTICGSWVKKVGLNQHIADKHTLAEDGQLKGLPPGNYVLQGEVAKSIISKGEIK